jgi:16S rRNA (cytidine1402-2'-O)-methyltransferase
VPSKDNSTTGNGVKPSGAGAACKPSTPNPAPTLPQGLYIVATPIGNARDITLRALEVLHGADIVLCEDTRVTKKLFSYHQISTSLLPYHEHNARRMRPVIMEHLKNGESVALVSDAGTPLVSDPGYRLVEACIEENITLTTLPGASSVLCALVLSGLPTDRFFFEGFLPNKSGQRQKALAQIKNVPGSLVFLESAKRLAASLDDMAKILGDRPVAVTRELTKLFEEVKRGSLRELAGHYGESGPPKGEVTLVVGPPEPVQAPEGEELDRLIIDALETMPVKEAAGTLAKSTGLAKRHIYNRALELKWTDG